MDLELKDRFLELWTRYFAGAELPIVFYYTDRPGPGKPHRRTASRVSGFKTTIFTEMSVSCTQGLSSRIVPERPWRQPSSIQTASAEP